MAHLHQKLVLEQRPKVVTYVHFFIGLLFCTKISNSKIILKKKVKVDWIMK